MARKVTNLVIFEQGTPDTGFAGTFVATWAFKGDQALANTNSFVGQWVTIKSGATYYNGAPIPPDVLSDQWGCIAVSGDRATLNQNRSNTVTLNASINIKYLEFATGTSPDLINTLDHFNVKWFYDAGNGFWYDGTEEDVEQYDTAESTYSPPEGAIGVWVHVTPVAKTYETGPDNNKVQVPYWNGTPVAQTFYLSEWRPETPSVPTVEIDGTTLTCSIENITDSRADQIQFEIFNETGKIHTATVRVIAQRATYTYEVPAGGSYRVRCRALNVVGTGTQYSVWTDLSSAVQAVPSAPESIITLRALSSTSVYLEWSSVESADTYDIEYTTNINYFDGSNSTTTQTGIEQTHYTLTGLETGDEYFFRVRAVNEQGGSGWSEIKSIAIGKAPAAPTTWSSATTVIVGKPLNLYWVHNAEDGSKETYAEVEITVGDDKQTHTVRNPTADDDEAEETTSFYAVDTSEYTEGTQLKWRVRTAGVTNTYGDWSIMRTVDIYAQPTLVLTLTNQNGDTVETLDSFPLYIKGLAGPSTQMPIGYHVEITANSGYETVDNMGNTVRIKTGEAVYSKYIDTNDPLLIELNAGNIDLQNDITYTVTVIASMNSGLTVTASDTFSVSWADVSYEIDCSIAIDPDIYAAYITPYCSDPDEDYAIVSGVHMAVYRREFDGSFTEIATGIDPSKSTTVTDPHPALDFARYRVVATDDATGAVSYYDPPGYPTGGQEVVIQWDEKWVDFEIPENTTREEPVWQGSMLKLPYNIDVSDNNTPEVTMVNYIGRTYPVSYYGTAIDTTSSWSVEIPASDSETIYALRRLSVWKGDAYVREPSGTGYWANITVSFTKTHMELTIPVSFTITRVEGGM